MGSGQSHGHVCTAHAGSLGPQSPGERSGEFWIKPRVVDSWLIPISSEAGQHFLVFSDLKMSLEWSCLNLAENGSGPFLISFQIASVSSPPLQAHPAEQHAATAASPSCLLLFGRNKHPPAFVIIILPLPRWEMVCTTFVCWFSLLLCTFFFFLTALKTSIPAYSAGLAGRSQPGFASLRLPQCALNLRGGNVTGSVCSLHSSGINVSC